MRYQIMSFLHSLVSTESWTALISQMSDRDKWFSMLEVDWVNNASKALQTAWSEMSFRLSTISDAAKHLKSQSLGWRVHCQSRSMFALSGQNLSLRNVLLVVFLVLLACLILGLALSFVLHAWRYLLRMCLCRWWKWKDEHEACAAPVIVFQDLLSVLTPTCSIWPPDFVDLIPQKTSPNFFLSSSIPRSRSGIAPDLHASDTYLPLSLLLTAIYEGSIELRNPIGDLPDMLSDATPGVKLRLEWWWWMEVLRWILSHEDAKYADMQTLLREENLNSTKASKSSPALLSFISHPSKSSRATPRFYLDFLPYLQLKQFFRSLRDSTCEGILQKDTSFRLEFSAISAKVSLWSTAHVICSLPFLPPRYFRSCNGPTFSRRASTPLFLTITRLIELLNANLSHHSDSARGASPSQMQSAFRIQSATSTTEARITSLHDAYNILISDPSVRTAFIKQWGIEAWRERLFMMAWEHAILKNGWLERWTVVCTRQPHSN